MKIGIIGAMEPEVAILKAAISDITEVNKGGCTFFSGQLDGVDVVLLQSDRKSTRLNSSHAR